MRNKEVKNVVIVQQQNERKIDNKYLIKKTCAGLPELNE